MGLSGLYWSTAHPVCFNNSLPLWAPVTGGGVVKVVPEVFEHPTHTAPLLINHLANDQSNFLSSTKWDRFWPLELKSAIGLEWTISILCINRESGSAGRRGDLEQGRAKKGDLVTTESREVAERSAPMVPEASRWPVPVPMGLQLASFW